MINQNGRAFYLVGRIAMSCLALVSFGLLGCATTSAELSMNPPGVMSGMKRAESAATITGEKDSTAGGDTAETQPAEWEATSPEDTSPQPSSVETTSIQDRWGIEIVRIRLTAAGHMLDFCYRVVDPDKALPILDPRLKAYLIDQKSGAKFAVPNPPKIGSLRQTTRSGKPVANRIYFVLFANPGRLVEAGNRVTVVIGDFRAEDLIVQ